MIYNYEYFLGLGCSKFQAKRRAKIINSLNKETTQELSTGVIYSEMRELKIPKVESFILETVFWLTYDKIHPPTPWERGLINFTEGVSKLKYNQIALI